ncbi:folate synthesis bifunctional protein, mitochondrial-like [Andrographis paniculata]|uniref:folate synthesis bifunctional protein, mitochondrial-like n=1 Tax=Andrographis paniculata TaxID=175694 RepID=UPI0021E9A73E|nr:folate synthesis bifunctional protein, mitochondrial-like [Andrographis paniculata]
MNIIRRLVPIKYGSQPAKNSCKASLSRLLHDGSVEVNSQEHEVVIALGSNVGDRLNNFDNALDRMKKSGIRITRHGCLYETEPAYVTDQPHFLNSAVRGKTKLDPHTLLAVLKEIERDMGRTAGGIRYGPRPIDLDILFYGSWRINTDDLTVPHERIWERPFVMGPLIDLIGFGRDDDNVESWHSLSGCSGGLFEAWEKLGGESVVGKDGMKRVFPVANQLWNWSEKTSIMGVVNVTPDSFSDGGKYLSVESAVSRVRSLIVDGADFVDLGAQSTRPMAAKLSPEQELERLIPVLEAVKNLDEMEGKLISVDTFYSQVALEAIDKGAHLVNDVSAGKLDPEMHHVIASCKAPYVAMHMRGDPGTMQNEENLVYEDVCRDVATELYASIRSAELSGVAAWRMAIDPGIGFSKNTRQNLDILAGLQDIRSEIGKKSLAMSRAPLLIGPSRKRFLGEICGRPSAADRDPATVAAVTAGVLGGADIVRVHNVRDNRDAVKLCDAILQR